MENHIKEMAEIFKILSNEVRLCIVANLCFFGEKKVSELQNCSGASQSFVSQQLSKLKDLGIVAARKEGVEIYYTLVDERICSVLNKIDACNMKKEDK